MKLTTTTEGEKRGEGKLKKKSKRIYRTSQKLRIINVFLESLLSESFPSLEVTAQITSLGCPPTLCWALDLLWGQLRFWSGPIPVCSCLQCPQLSEIVHFLLWERSMALYIFHRHRVCLTDRVDLICILYRWREGFGSSSLATLPLGFNCGFISTSACGRLLECKLLRLPWRAWVCPCEGQVWRWCSCLDCRGSGSTRYSWGGDSYSSRKYKALEGHGNQYWPIRCSSILGQAGYIPLVPTGKPPIICSMFYIISFLLLPSPDVCFCFW